MRRCAGGAAGSAWRRAEYALTSDSALCRYGAELSKAEVDKFVRMHAPYSSSDIEAKNVKAAQPAKPIAPETLKLAAVKVRALVLVPRMPIRQPACLPALLRARVPTPLAPTPLAPARAPAHRRRPLTSSRAPCWSLGQTTSTRS